MTSKKQNLKSAQLVFRMALIGFAVFIALSIYLLFFIRAKVSVEVEPTSAVVTLDNKPAPILNRTASFVTSLGKHTLRVDADNYVGYKEEIDLSRGKNYSKKIALKKAPSPIEITANASNISVKDNNVYFLNPLDRLFYLSKINFSDDGQGKVESTQAITSKPVDNFNQIIWSPNREMVLIKRGSTVYALDFKKYDFVNQKEILYSENVGDIAWAPDNSRIAYYYSPPGGEKSLMFADADNKNLFRAANLADLGIEDPYLAFSPSSEWLVIIPRNSDFNKNQVYLMNIYTKAITNIVSTGNQKEAVFTYDSNKVIFSTYSDNPRNPAKQLLSTVELDGSKQTALNIPIQASTVRYWKNPNQVFLPINVNGCRLVLVDLNNGKNSEFFFDGQRQSKIEEIYLNSQSSGAVFVSEGKLYFVKLEGNE